MSDKTRLLHEADEAFGDLRQAIDGLDDARLARIWLGSWGVREILIHISGWHEEMIQALARIGRGEPAYATGTYEDFDAWNARFVDAAHGVKTSDVVARVESSHREFVRAAGAVPEQRFEDAKGVLDGCGTAHYREHAGQIRAWRQKEST